MGAKRPQRYGAAYLKKKKEDKNSASRNVEKAREKRLLLDSRFCTNHLR
jgi:hypothetical protein